MVTGLKIKTAFTVTSFVAGTFGFILKNRNKWSLISVTPFMKMPFGMFINVGREPCDSSLRKKRFPSAYMVFTALLQYDPNVSDVE